MLLNVRCSNQQFARKRSMNTLLHALKPPDIQGYYLGPQSRTVGRP